MQRSREASEALKFWSVESSTLSSQSLPELSGGLRVVLETIWKSKYWVILGKMGMILSF
jgi:hypothetical protein